MSWLAIKNIVNEMAENFIPILAKNKHTYISGHYFGATFSNFIYKQYK